MLSNGALTEPPCLICQVLHYCHGLVLQCLSARRDGEGVAVSAPEVERIWVVWAWQLRVCRVSLLALKPLRKMEKQTMGDQQNVETVMCTCSLLAG